MKPAFRTSRWKILKLMALAGAAFVTPALTAEDQPKHPEYVLGGTEIRTLPQSANGRQYQLLIALPYSFRDNPTRKYPVVFMTDGYWSFTRMVGLYGSLVYDQVVPEYITVGLSYAGDNLEYDKMRAWELSPVRLGLFGSSGHADKFLESLENEIIPFMEREYRADPNYRVLGGGSLGGLFTLYALFTKPDLFTGYIAMSPSIQAGGDWIFKHEAAFAASKRPLKARLFLSVGGYEWPGFVENIKRFHERLEARKYPGLDYHFRFIDGERHGASTTEGTNRGLRYVFEPIAPQTGPQ